MSDPLRWAHSPLQISRACMPTVIATGSALMRAYDTGARRYVNSILSLMLSLSTTRVRHHDSVDLFSNTKVSCNDVETVISSKNCDRLTENYVTSRMCAILPRRTAHMPQGRRRSQSRVVARCFVRKNAKKSRREMRDGVLRMSMCPQPHNYDNERKLFALCFPTTLFSDR